MARNRVIYQSEALFVSENASSAAAAKHEQIERVQSANFSYTINRQDVNQFGNLARIDSLVLDPPTVSVDFSYYLTDGFNERALGFFVETGALTPTTGNFASGHMIGSSGKNIYIATSPEGSDINRGGALGADDSIIGIGNAYVSDYSVDMSVGSLPTVSMTMEGANVNSSISGANFLTPAVDQENGTAVGLRVALPNPSSGNSSPITALRPGDITVTLDNFAGETISMLTGNDSAHVQSVSISLPLSRSPLDRLGSRFPFAREVDFPVNVSMSISAIVNETESMNLTDALQSGVQTATVTLKDENSVDAMIWTLKGAQVDSESYSSSIGSNQTVDITLSAQVGGPADNDAGLFASGASNLKLFV